MSTTLPNTFTAESFSRSTPTSATGSRNLALQPAIPDTGFDIFRGFLWAMAFELSAAAIIVGMWYFLHVR